MNIPKVNPKELGPEEKIVAPIERTRKEFWIVVSILGFFALTGFLAWMWQIRYGLGVTGLNQPVYWGIYIIDFVFFIGISHAGTLISAILRATKAEWRRTITRSAEMITVLVLIIGGIQPIIDLGRPDRIANILYHPHLRSPLLWDVISITTYL